MSSKKASKDELEMRKIQLGTLTQSSIFTETFRNRVVFKHLK
jgi:hypothetical protein